MEECTYGSGEGYPGMREHKGCGGMSGSGGVRCDMDLAFGGCTSMVNTAGANIGYCVCFDIELILIARHWFMRMGPEVDRRRVRRFEIGVRRLLVIPEPLRFDMVIY